MFRFKSTFIFLFTVLSGSTLSAQLAWKKVKHTPSIVADGIVSDT
jgi:hypothetical protein